MYVPSGLGMRHMQQQPQATEEAEGLHKVFQVSGMHQIHKKG